MNLLRIEEALTHLNRSRALNGLKPMTRGELMKIVFPDLPDTTSKQYFSHLKAGRRMSALQPIHIVRICQTTGVSSDFLLGLSAQIRPQQVA